MEGQYIFTSDRLGFRPWQASDLAEFAEINSDDEVMEHFPKPLSKTETADFIIRLQKHFQDRAYTYFATEILETKELIGFIGLAYQDYPSEYTPSTDIGWRLKKTAWGKGFATEGAKQCLEYAFKRLKLNRVIAICTVGNTKSESVMQKIGMTKKGEFNHPRMKTFPACERCVCYEINPVD